MMETIPPAAPTKVFMWSTPRSLSTAIEKCFSYVPDSVIWHEPYLGAMWYGKDERSTPLGKALREKSHDDHQSGTLDQRIEAVSLPKGAGYEERSSSYGWCKEQLEANHTGKSLVFVKDMTFALSARFDAIPDGYKHSFLIRHPMKVIPSWKRLMCVIAGKDIKLTELSGSALPSGCFFKESYDLLCHIKEKFESNPVIIDADDLLENPPKMLKAYCEALKIPYSDDLLQWESDDDIENTWKIPRRLLRANEILNCYSNALSSTQFNKPGSIPSRSDLAEDELYCVDNIMPYYEEMYAQRLTC